MPKPRRCWPTHTSQKTANPSMTWPQFAASQTNNNTIRQKWTPATRTTCPRKKHRTSTTYRVVPELLSKDTTTTATSSEETTATAAKITTASLQLSRQAHQDRAHDPPRAQTRHQTRPTSTPLLQQRRRRSSILTANYTPLTQTLRPAMALSARYMRERQSATRDDATRTGQGETAGGDAVNRRRPPNQQQQRFIVRTRPAQQTELAYGRGRLRQFGTTFLRTTG